MHQIKKKLPTLLALVFGDEPNAVKTLVDSTKDTDLNVYALNDDLVQVVHSKTQRSATLARGSVLVVEGTKITTMSRDDFDAEYEITGPIKPAKATNRTTKSADKTAAKTPDTTDTAVPNDDTADTTVPSDTAAADQ